MWSVISSYFHLKILFVTFAHNVSWNNRSLSATQIFKFSIMGKTKPSTTETQSYNNQATGTHTHKKAPVFLPSISLL